MIHASLLLIRDQLTTNKHNKYPVILANVADISSHPAYQEGELLAISLVRIMEDNTARNTYIPRKPEDKLSRPAFFLNLFIQITACCVAGATTYERSLQILDNAAQFFHSNPIIEPAKGSSIVKLTLDFANPTLSELNDIWAMNGTSYMPSLYYNCRIVPA